MAKSLPQAGNRRISNTARQPAVDGCLFGLVCLLNGMIVAPEALADQNVFGATASYSYSGFFSDFSGPLQPLSKADTQSTLGFKSFRDVAISDESSFSGPRGTTASATASAHASDGRLGVSTSADANAIQARSTVSLKVDAKASLFDIVTLTAPKTKSSAQKYHLENAMTLEGSVQHSIVYAIPNYYPPKGNDYVEAAVDVGLSISGTGIAAGPYAAGQYAHIGEGASVFSGFPHVDNEAPASVHLSMDLVYGQPTPVFWTMEISGDALVQDFDALTHFPGKASLVGQFSHSLAWGPVTTVTDATTGEVIHDWTITSKSGFGYGTPVPEPDLPMLLVSGLLLLSISRHPKVLAIRQLSRAAACTI